MYNNSRQRTPRGGSYAATRSPFHTNTHADTLCLGRSNSVCICVLLFVSRPLMSQDLFFCFQTTDVPRFIISDMSVSGQNKKYLYEGKMEKAEIATFATDVLGGKLSPTLKSEEPLDEDLENPVKVVKGKSFESIVMNNSKVPKENVECFLFVVMVIIFWFYF